MNKKEMAAKLAKVTGLSRAKAAEVLNAIFHSDKNQGIIASELDRGKKVTIPGFGTFATRKTAPRSGINPSTRKAMNIPAKTKAYFRPGKTLRDRIAK